MATRPNVSRGDKLGCETAMKVRGIGYWILDIGYWILDIGYWIFFDPNFFSYAKSF